jgi:hypothetical protein
MKLLPTEACLTGKWALENGSLVADEVCARIEDLTRSYLRELARDASGWDTLYMDPNDGRFWERIYPEGHQGGGPPELRHLASGLAKEKYGVVVPEA